MQIFVKTSDGSRAVLYANVNDYVISLKKMLHELIPDIEVKNMILKYNSQILYNKDTLSKYGILNKSMLELESL